MFDTLKKYGVKIGIVTGAIGGTLLLLGYIASGAGNVVAYADGYIKERAKETYAEIQLAASVQTQRQLKGVQRRLNGVQEKVNKQSTDTKVTREKVEGIDKRLDGFQSQLNTIIQLMNKQ